MGVAPRAVPLQTFTTRHSNRKLSIVMAFLSTVALPGFVAKRGTNVAWCLHEATVDIVAVRLFIRQSIAGDANVCQPLLRNAPRKLPNSVNNAK